MHVVFYASAHGMGHLVRLSEIGRALLEIEPGCRLSYRGRVRNSVLSARTGQHFEDTAEEVDVGLVETDMFTQDLEETARSGARLLERWDNLRAQEARFLQEGTVDAVVCDLPGVPLEAAADAGIPGIAVGNFSWDWVYGVYHETLKQPVFGRMSDRFRRAYGTAACLARIPVGPPMTAFGKTMDVGLVGRSGDPDRIAQLREEYAMGTPCVFLAIQKAADPRLLARGIARTPGHRFFGFLDLEAERTTYTRVKDEDQTFFPELVWIADAVIATLGHSILSECAVNRTPIVTPPRLDYPEYEVLLSEGRRTHPIVEIGLEDFRAGRWANAIEQAQTLSPPDPPLPADGAKQIARIIREKAKGTP